MSFAGKIGQMVAKGPNSPMNPEQMNILLVLSMLGEENVEKQQSFYNDVTRESPLFRIFHNRCNLHMPDMKASIPALLWLGSMVQTPGQCVLVVALIKHLLESGHEITLRTLVDKVFPYGIPTVENFNSAWDAQKVTPTRLSEIDIGGLVRGDNMLDLRESWR